MSVNIKIAIAIVCRLEIAMFRYRPTGRRRTERHQHKAFVNYVTALKPYCLQSLAAARELRTPLHHKTKDSVEQHGTGETGEKQH